MAAGKSAKDALETLREHTRSCPDHPLGALWAAHRHLSDPVPSVRIAALVLASEALWWLGRFEDARLAAQAAAGADPASAQALWPLATASSCTARAGSRRRASASNRPWRYNATARRHRAWATPDQPRPPPARPGAHPRNALATTVPPRRARAPRSAPRAPGRSVAMSSRQGPRADDRGSCACVPAASQSILGPSAAMAVLGGDKVEPPCGSASQRLASVEVGRLGVRHIPGAGVMRGPRAWHHGGRLTTLAGHHGMLAGACQAPVSGRPLRPCSLGTLSTSVCVGGGWRTIVPRQRTRRARPQGA